MAEISEALKEAYASNPADQVIIDTLEFRHPSFVDDRGHSAAFRVVNQYEQISGRLESSAPMQAGEYVTFQPFAFDLTLPGFEEGQVPTLQIDIDNVGREMMRQLESATTSQQPIEVTYRPFILTDLSYPQMDPPITMVVTGATADLHKISFKASMDSVSSIAFPRRIYTSDDFPGLVR